MRTDELRAMLQEHGDEVTDAGVHQRLDSVRGRVRQVRRRRTAGVVGVVAAAAVGLVGVVVPGTLDQDSGPAEAPTRLAGHEVPRTEVAAGYTYEYVRGVEAEAAKGPLRLRLPASDEPRLVMWAGSAGSGHTLRLDVLGSEGGLVRPVGDFEDYQLLWPHTAHRLVLAQDDAEADDRLALAVFELSDQRPAGVTRNGITYRERILDDTLLDAVIGDPGEATVKTRVTLPAGELRLSATCFGREVGLGTGYEVVVSVEDRDLWGASCSEHSQIDQGSDGSTVTNELRRRGFAPGDVVEVRARLEHMDAEDVPVEDTDAVVGIGAYKEGGDTLRVAGWDLPERIEHEGHEWALSTVSESAAGDAVHTFTRDAGTDPVLLVTATKDLANGSRVRLEVDGRVRESMEFYTGPEAGSWGPDTVLEPGRGREVTLRVRKGLTDRTRLAAVLYEMVH